MLKCCIHCQIYKMITCIMYSFGCILRHIWNCQGLVDSNFWPFDYDVSTSTVWSPPLCLPNLVNLHLLFCCLNHKPLLIKSTFYCWNQTLYVWSQNFLVVNWLMTNVSTYCCLNPPMKRIYKQPTHRSIVTGIIMNPQFLIVKSHVLMIEMIYLI